MSSEDRRIAGRFPSTDWSAIALAGQEDFQGKRNALGELLARDLPALRAHLTRKGIAAENADDLLQEFVAKKVVEKDLIAGADRSRGRFRTFLLTALDRFAANYFRHARAHKRHPQTAALVSIEDSPDVVDTRGNPSHAFDVAWAHAVVSETLRRMQHDCVGSGRSDVWDVFDQCLVGPALHGAERVHYRQLVERFGFQSPVQLSNMLVTGKRLYAKALRLVIAEYAGADTEEIEAEIQDLRKNLARCGAIFEQIPGIT